jgi:hypothetical protein
LPALRAGSLERGRLAALPLPGARSQASSSLSGPLPYT